MWLTADRLDGLRRLAMKKPDDGGVTGGESALACMIPSLI